MFAVVRFYDDKNEQYRTGLLVKSGDKYAHLVVFEPTGLRTARIPTEDETDLTYYDNFTPQSALWRYRQLEAQYGANEGAKHLLGEAERMLDLAA